MNDLNKSIRSVLRKAGLKITSRAKVRHANYISREEGYLTEEGNGYATGSIYITWIPIHDSYAGHRLPWLSATQRTEMLQEPLSQAQQILIDAGYTVTNHKEYLTLTI